ncbi:MAG TPA: ADOP family duplicated permease [Candidatus Sulfotelmatobacter sp.]|nr:ADOP family duplicated permease [Candidatus Sulfotelmatobacter sp.]
MNIAWRIYLWRIYRRLAEAFPHEFKLAYGTEVVQLGEDVAKEMARRHGVAGLIWLIADIAVRVPLEYLSEMRRDMRYGLRGLIKSPGFALVGIVSMGLGMGLTTMLYSSKWQLISRDLAAAANAKRLVMPEKPVSYYYIAQYREQKDLFSGVAAFQTGVPFNVGFEGDVKAKPERVFGQLVSADYFSVLGLPPQRGRVLGTELDKAGDAPVVVVSDRFWRHRLNSSPDAVGQTLRLNGQPATIVGITPKDFNGALGVNPAELFVPITAPAALAPELANDVLHRRNAKEFMALMCLSRGVTMESAEAALDVITRHLDAQDPTLPARTDKDTSRRVTLLSAGTRVPLPRKVRMVVVGFFAVLMALIMTIACMNLANMLLARGANRQKELAIRLAVGASRFRLVRQMMSEGILLSLLGGVAGFALAYVLSAVSAHFMPPTALPVESNFTPDWGAAVFVYVLVMVCGIGFSLAPALRATKVEVTPTLKGGAALQVPGYRRLGARNLLMVSQVAGSLMLLLITGFLVLGLSKASDVQTKFDAHTMYLLAVDPVRDGYSAEKAQALFERLPERLKAAGAVNNVALAAQAPFSIQDDEDAGVQMSAEDSTGGRVQQPVIPETVGANYFAALSEPMLAGREFAELDQRADRQNTVDGATSLAVVLPAILNASAARGFFGNGNAIGKRVRDEKQAYEVVGVVSDLKNGIGIRQSIVYLPLTRRNFARPPVDGMTILVRVDSGADALSGIRREMASIDPSLNVFNVRTLSDYLEASRAAERFSVSTYGGIGIFGLVLAAIGLAGVTAYSVAQRRKEIGIRMALGARKWQVLLLMLREGSALVGAGTVLGFVGAFVLAKSLSTLSNIFVDALQVGMDDPRLLVGAPLLLAGLALLACYVPARRAAKIDPLKALRQE